MQAKVSDIINLIEKIAPPGLAEEWDNPGLQVGSSDWPVKKVWIALDPTPDVVDAACKGKVDLLVTHHPLIFNPVKSIDFASTEGYVIHKAAVCKLAVYSAHTNLDSAEGGLNDLLASRIGIKNTRALCDTKVDAGKCKFVVYVPSGHEQKIIKSLFETRAGIIGSYTCCSFRSSGRGTFRPGSTAKPFSGKTGEISDVDEVRIETVAAKADIPEIIEHVRKSHPYETMAYDAYPLREYDKSPGMGRFGELEEKTELYILAEKIKSKLSLKNVKFAGNPKLSVTHAAVCTGSGSGLLKDFIRSGAQVYITGDLRYHDAKSAEANGRGLIDIGHFASEHIIVKELAGRLGAMIKEAGYDVLVEACGIERDPFGVL